MLKMSVREYYCYMFIMLCSPKAKCRTQKNISLRKSRFTRKLNEWLISCIILIVKMHYRNDITHTCLQFTGHGAHRAHKRIFFSFFLNYYAVLLHGIFNFTIDFIIWIEHHQIIYNVILLVMIIEEDV